MNGDGKYLKTLCMQKTLDAIRGVTNDSSKVKEGDAFFAIKGTTRNGEDYIEEAIQNGASLIVVDDSFSGNFTNCEFIKVKNIRKFLSEVLRFRNQQLPQNIVTVTGTNGKTSVSCFFQQITAFLGEKSASIGTLRLSANDDILHQRFPSSLTTPSAIHLMEMLNALKEENYSSVSIEASSHGLDQYRIDAVRLKAGGFTNFSQDHLDYHHNTENYFAAKLRLFDEVLEPGAYAVLNKDIKEYERISEVCKKRNIKMLSYGKKDSDIKIILSGSQEYELEIFGSRYKFLSHINGDFQIYNIACAVGLAIACGFDINKIMSSLSHLKAAKGRFEFVGSFNDADIYIDYAHTPDALLNLLTSAKRFCRNRLHVLFGCGGERDVSKRYEMGRIASKYADEVIVTDDNPRNEDPDKIRLDIIKSCKNGKNISGRSNAIKHAISRLQKGDVLVIAGKGHEEYQILKNGKIFFSDHNEVKKALDSCPF